MRSGTMYSSSVRRGIKLSLKICTVVCIVLWTALRGFISIKTSTLYVKSNQLNGFDSKQSRVVTDTECKETVSFLKQIDSTVNLELFCNDDWTTHDVLCSYFLQQNVFSERDMCRLPRDGLVVPKIVYYVVFSQNSTPPEFLFMHYLSIVSAKRYIKPWAIYFISDIMPIGYWWTRVQNDVNGIRFVFRKSPIFADGNITYVQHKSDVVRLQFLLTNGGIYLDTDVMIIKSLDPIRHYPLTMGILDNGTGMGNAIILAERRSSFIREWYRSYFHYRHTWNGNSLKVPMDLWLQNNRVLHLESEMFYRPNWYETKKLFHEVGYNWQNKYAVHIWHRHGYVPRNVTEINRLNSTLGEIFRYVYYGSKEMVSRDRLYPISP